MSPMRLRTIWIRSDGLSLQHKSKHRWTTLISIRAGGSEFQEYLKHYKILLATKSGLTKLINVAQDHLNKISDQSNWHVHKAFFCLNLSSFSATARLFQNSQQQLTDNVISMWMCAQAYCVALDRIPN